MIAALTIALVHGVPALASCGWAAGRDGDRLAVAIDAALPARQLKQAFLLAVTDGEYDAYEATLPIAEQHRRIEATWQWRHLPRRQAMLTHLNRFTDGEYDVYEAALPKAELDRRMRARAAGLLRLVALPQPATVLA